MKNQENHGAEASKKNGDSQSAKGGTLREGGTQVPVPHSASDFSTCAHGAGASSVRKGGEGMEPFALVRQVRQPDGSRRWEAGQLRRQVRQPDGSRRWEAVAAATDNYAGRRWLVTTQARHAGAGAGLRVECETLGGAVAVVTGSWGGVPLSEASAAAAELAERCRLVGWGSLGGAMVQVLPDDTGRRWNSAAERRTERTRAYLDALARLGGQSGDAVACAALVALMEWARLMVERDNANAVEELGRQLRARGSERGDSAAESLLVLTGCVLSALAAASLGLETESMEQAPLPGDGREAWEAWAYDADGEKDLVAQLWERAVKP